MRYWIGALFGLALAPVAAAQKAGAPQEALGVTRFEVQHLSLPAQGWEAFDVKIRLGARDYDVAFTPHSVRGPNYRLVVQTEEGALEEVAPPAEMTYHGSVADVPGAVVAGSLTEGRLTAMIRVGTEPGETWSIHPMSDMSPGAPPGAHVVSSDRDLIPGPARCGVTELPKPQMPGRGRAGGAGGVDAFLACQVACDADHEFFVANGSNVTNTNNDIATVINGMAAVYQADANVTFVLGTVIVRQSATQPYTATESGALLISFRNEWNANQGATVRDIAHLFTGKELDGATVGLAYTGVVCTTGFAYGLSQSRYTLNTTMRIGLTSHEVGHNFNLGHCDTSCSPCRIMCSGLGGCSGVVSSFGCSAPALAAYAPQQACLTPLNNGLTTFLDVFATTTLDYNRWPTPTNSGGVVNANGVTERSAPNSLDLANTAAITTAGIDLTGLGSHRAFVSFWAQHRGVEAGKTLAVAYRRPAQGDFLPLTTLTSNGTDQVQYFLTQVLLPTDGHGANGALRFTAQGNQVDDHWYIDDVKVSRYCRADLTEDWTLNIFDFLAFQAGLSALNYSICDWDGDGFISVLDFNAFINSYSAGCAGY